MSQKTRVIISAITKYLILGFATAGILACVFGSGFMAGGNILLKYFTIQSNIWIGLFGLIIGTVQFVNLKHGVLDLKRWAYVLQLVLTTSITLTGVVFCFVLLPTMVGNEAMRGTVLAWPQIFLHVVVPILSVVDLLVWTRPVRFNFKFYDSLFSLIPPLYYLVFSRIGYVRGWDFGGGVNYPYFFLNYDSPAGLIGFSKEMPYFMGVIWWIIAIALFVLLVSRFYQYLMIIFLKKNRQKMI